MSFRLVLWATALAAVFLSSACVQVAFGQTYKLMSTTPYAATDAVRVLITGVVGDFVEEQTVVRLSSNCANAASTAGVPIVFTSGDRRPSQGGGTTWSVQFVDSFSSIGTVGTNGNLMYVCFSRNAGVTYTTMNNMQNRAAFVVWRYAPVATLGRLPPRQGAGALTVAVTPIDAEPNSRPGVAAETTGALRLCIVPNPDNCFSANPATVAGGAAVTLGGNGLFTFAALTAAVPKAYMCYSTNGGTVWSLIPFNNYKNSVVDSRLFNTREIEPADFSFPIIGSTEQRFTLSCDPSPPVAGLSVTCTVGITGSGPATATNIIVSSLTDGGGAHVCPLPAITGSKFTFTPDRSGRDGHVSIGINGGSILEADPSDPGTAAYFTYQWTANAPATGVTTTQRVIAPESRDFRKVYFEVKPSPLDIFPFSSANLIAGGSSTPFAAFTGIANFALSRGVMWYKPRNYADTTFEPQAATLTDAAPATATTSVTVTAPTNAERCRVSVKYFYSAEGPNGISSTTDVFIGSIAVQSGATTVREFRLYSYLRYVIVTGGDNPEPGALDGYIRTEEQLVSELPVAAGTTVTLSLTADRSGGGSKLYFIDPRITCAIAPTTSTDTNAAATDPNDLIALQNIVAAVGGTMSAGWTNPLASDPCRNHWEGIICRRNRVTELHLRFQNLAGTFPTFTDTQMAFLEVIDVRDNALTGVWNVGAGLTRLRDVRIANNQITSVISGGTAFSHSAHKCLAYFDASNNNIAAFPATGIIDSTSLESVDLSVNAMANTLPTSFAAMSRLRLLNLNQNSLTGTLPTQLPTQSLRSFDVSRNAFTGGIPATYTDFRNLLLFDVSHNQLSGKMSVVPMSVMRDGHASIFRAGFNSFTYLPGRHHFRREGQMGNFFQCPLIEQREAVWLPYADTYEGPMRCDWTEVTEEA